MFLEGIRLCVEDEYFKYNVNNVNNNMQHHWELFINIFRRDDDHTVMMKKRGCKIKS